jgi:hypothetical protein
MAIMVMMPTLMILTVQWIELVMLMLQLQLLLRR